LSGYTEPENTPPPNSPNCSPSAGPPSTEPSSAAAAPKSADRQFSPGPITADDSTVTPGRRHGDNLTSESGDNFTTLHTIDVGSVRKGSF